MRQMTIALITMTSVAALACTEPAEHHDDACGGAGGDGDAGGAPSAVECKVADDCTGPHWRCERRTCIGGVCGHEYADEGTPDLVDSFPGDCSILVCDGAGRSHRSFDANDNGDDGDSCTSESCAEGGGRFIEIASNGVACVSYIGDRFTVGVCAGGTCVDM